MKKCFLISLSAFLGLCLNAQEFKAVDAVDLTLTGKAVPTVNPYHRLDVDSYPSMTDSEKRQAGNCSGIAVAFRTDSRFIGVDVDYRAAAIGDNSPQIATRGFDLYIRKDGEWVWAGNGMPPKRDANVFQRANLLADADEGWKDCLVYLPLFSELNDLLIVLSAGAQVEALENPFRGRVAVFGSSFTQGSGASRCAMTYSAQLSRMTGYEFINLGFAGNSKLQDYFADALCDAAVDAFLFDAFSNPTPQEMEERLFPFIEKIRKAHPGKPLVFMKSIRREKRNFSQSYDKKEKMKQDMADSLMNIAVTRYEDVYWIESTSATGAYHECTTDGTHPDSHGYTIWAESIRDTLSDILAKYIQKQ
ncbi:MAG: SGNH/GDSL hydrolase family protein [Candidatus Cryptobacteroides sp.]